MSDVVRGVVVAHGTMAAGLVSAVREITGLDGEALVPISNKGISPDALAAQVRAGIRGATIVFTDLLSGSCGFAARRSGRDAPDCVIITGVNLPMLLEFAMHRELPLQELVPKILSRARASITASPAHYETHEHRAASGG